MRFLNIFSVFIITITTVFLLNGCGNDGDTYIDAKLTFILSNNVSKTDVDDIAKILSPIDISNGNDSFLLFFRPTGNSMVVFERLDNSSSFTLEGKQGDLSVAGDKQSEMMEVDIKNKVQEECNKNLTFFTKQVIPSNNGSLTKLLQSKLKGIDSARVILYSPNFDLSSNEFLRNYILCPSIDSVYKYIRKNRIVNNAIEYCIVYKPDASSFRATPESIDSLPSLPPQKQEPKIKTKPDESASKQPVSTTKTNSPLPALKLKQQPVKTFDLKNYEAKLSIIEKSIQGLSQEHPKLKEFKERFNSANYLLNQAKASKTPLNGTTVYLIDQLYKETNNE